MEYKEVVDTLASLAALVAIVGAMIAWYRSARRPLKIKRVVLHKAEKKTTFILVIKNVKDYPVTIKSTDCYRRKKYQVQRKSGGKPEYSELFPSSQRVFFNRDIQEIPANGDTDIQIQVPGSPSVPTELLFLLETSHGYHELWCSEMISVDVGKVDVYSVDYKYEYESRWKAKLMYWWKLTREPF